MMTKTRSVWRETSVGMTRDHHLRGAVVLRMIKPRCRRTYLVRVWKTHVLCQYGCD